MCNGKNWDGVRCEHADGEWTIDCRAGVFQIMDTSWDSNGGMRVTVCETVGGGEFSGSREARMIAGMRRVARKALTHVQWTRLERVFYADGGQYATFTVSRLERDYYSRPAVQRGIAS